MDEECESIVLDNGSGTLKAGFAGNDAPSTVFPNIVGRPSPHEHVSSLFLLSSPFLCVGRHEPFHLPATSQCDTIDMDEKEIFIGDDTHSKRDILRLKHPIEYGSITRLLLPLSRMEGYKH